MSKTLKRIIGLKKSEFDSLVLQSKETKNDNCIQLSKARLIPLTKPGLENSLTSVFLSSLRLIKEFRKTILSQVNLSTSGKIYVYTEVCFPEVSKERPDGIILVVKGDTIIDCALFEMKNGNDCLKKNQIESYMTIAKELKIPKIITVSNEFVTEPTQSPLGIKSTKSLSLFHLSWSYILTVAHILLYKNDMNIEDEDQIEIMKEVVDYFESPKSGVKGFNQMKEGWSKVSDIISNGGRLRKNSEIIDEAVCSWVQEEKDLALALSKELGLFVHTGISKFKNDLKLRHKYDVDMLINKSKLTSRYKVKSAVSDIYVDALFDKRVVEMSVKMKLSQDKKSIKAKFNWAQRQINQCEKKEGESFDPIKEFIFVDVSAKGSPKSDRVKYSDIETLVEDYKDKEVTDIRIVCVKYFGDDFSSRTKFIEKLDSMMIDFYKSVVQHLRKWEPSAPKIMKDRGGEEIFTEGQDTSIELSQDDSTVDYEDFDVKETA